MVTINSSLNLNMSTTEFLGLPSDPYEDETPTSATESVAYATTGEGTVSIVFRGSFNPELLNNDDSLGGDGGNSDPFVNYLTGYTEYATSNPNETFSLDGMPNYSLGQFNALNLSSLLSGFDVITSGSYNDVIRGFGGGDAINGGTGNDTIYGGADYSDATDGSDQIYGGRGSDTIYGNAGNDTIYGGNDPVDAEDSDDVIFGGAGDDAIYGNAGNDILDGNTGNDSLYGGLGDDSFAFNANSGQDVIYGFQGDGVSGGDVLAISSSIYSSAVEAMQHLSTDGTHAYLDLGGGNGALILFGAELTVDDFSIF